MKVGYFKRLEKGILQKFSNKFLTAGHLFVLQCDRENREHLKCLRNVYCVMTNQCKDHDTRTSHKTTNWSCLRFSFLTPDWLFSCNTITFQKYSWNSGVHCFPGLTVKSFPAAGHVVACEQALCLGKNSEEREGKGGREPVDKHLRPLFRLL